MTNTMHPLANVPLPESIVVDFQPYGAEKIGSLRLVSYSDICNGAPRTLYGVAGIVLEGTETARIFQHTSTKNTAGQARTIWVITAQEIARGEFTRVAM